MNVMCSLVALLESPHWLFLVFDPRNVGLLQGPMDAICHSVNVDGVM